MEIVCIMCGAACALEAKEKKGLLEVKGNICRRGEVYGRKEYINPQRTVTTLFPIKGGGFVPCKTSLPVDKELIFDVLKAIKSSSAPKPIKAGKVLIKNILGTNADIVATSNVY